MWEQLARKVINNEGKRTHRDGESFEKKRKRHREHLLTVLFLFFFFSSSVDMILHIGDQVYSGKEFEDACAILRQSHDHWGMIDGGLHRR